MELKTKSLLKGGEFIIKDSQPEDIFTPEDFSEEQIMMKDSVQEFVDREIWPYKERFEKKDYEFTKQCMQKAGELGFLGVSVPENYGGMGMGFVSTMLVCDYISGATGSFSTAFGAHTGIGTMPIVLYGTEEQKQNYVPKLATGEWFGAYCLTEPGAGSDANSGKTTATLTDDGQHYSITGQKMWISNAGFCNVFIVFARIEDDKNITGFIVENDRSFVIAFDEAFINRSVIPPTAETTTTTLVVSIVFLTMSLTLRIFSAEPTDVPPNFKTFIIIRFKMGYNNPLNLINNEVKLLH